MKRSTLVRISAAGFALFWLLVFRLGAGRQLPDGFWKIVVLIVAADAAQTLFVAFVFWKHPSYGLCGAFFVTGMLFWAGWCGDSRLIRSGSWAAA